MNTEFMKYSIIFVLNGCGMKRKRYSNEFRADANR